MKADVLERHKQEWEELASVDPLWAILTSAERRGGRWELAEFFDTGEAEISEVLKLADDLGEPVRRERALDFGCGVGRLSRPLGERFRECVGLDISEGMVKLARELNEDRPSCRFVVNDAPDLERFDSASFDFVYSSLVLQHMPSAEMVEAYVGEFLRVLRPGGLAVFQALSHIPLALRLQPRRHVLLLPARPRPPRAAPADADEAHAHSGARDSRGEDAGAHRPARRHGRARSGYGGGARDHVRSLRYFVSSRLADGLPTSVVTVTFRAGPALLRCLDSLEPQEGLDETILVDNGGGGPEIEEAREREGVRVLEPDENIGFAGGCNLGARERAGRRARLSQSRHRRCAEGASRGSSERSRIRRSGSRWPACASSTSPRR